MNTYSVSVRRMGAAPFSMSLRVAAHSADEAAGLATYLAEHSSGGMFEARRVRRVRWGGGTLDAIAA